MNRAPFPLQKEKAGRFCGFLKNVGRSLAAALMRDTPGL